MKEKLAIIMVGLPARGKSYLSNKLNKYFKWQSYITEIYNVGDYRRKILGGFQESSFFDDQIIENKEMRDNIAINLFNQMVEWLHKEGDIAIFDATNSSEERRIKLIKICNDNNIKYLFIEIICDNENFIKSNLEMKLMSKDYINIEDREKAKEDFKIRLEHYKKVYSKINNNENINMKYIKLIDNRKIIQTYNINKFIEIETMNFLVNININKYPIYLSRHGESMDNLKGKLGGNSYLSNKGKKYKEVIANFFQKENLQNLKVYTSVLNRTKETSEIISKNFPTKHLKILNEINAGICEGLTYEEVKQKYPEIHIERKKDKFNYRYPEGESYRDIVERVNPFILKLERQEEPVLVISHNAITRVIYSYLMNIPPNKIPFFDIPLHTLIKLTPTSKGYNEERIQLIDENELYLC